MIEYHLIKVESEAPECTFARKKAWCERHTPSVYLAEPSTRLCLAFFS
jgi:hypothetical protein